MQFETDVVPDHSSGKDEVIEMKDEASSFIDDLSVYNNDDFSIYNSNIPNITRSYDDAMNDESSNFENLHGENFNLIFDSLNELDRFDDIIEEHPHTRKKLMHLKRLLHITKVSTR